MSDLRWEDWRAFTARNARRVARRLAAAGIFMEWQDLEQEFAVVWIHCTRAFNPTKGVGFAAYYISACNREVRKSVRRIKGRDAGVLTDSLEAKAERYASHDGDEGVGDAAYVSPLLRDSNTPEDDLIRKDSVNRALNASPLFARLAEISISPPSDLMDQIGLIEERRRWAERAGLPCTSVEHDGLNQTELFRIFRLNYKHRGSIREALAQEGFSVA